MLRSCNKIQSICLALILISQIKRLKIFLNTSLRLPYTDSSIKSSVFKWGPSRGYISTITHKDPPFRTCQLSSIWLRIDTSDSILIFMPSLQWRFISQKIRANKSCSCSISPLLPGLIWPGYWSSLIFWRETSDKESVSDTLLRHIASKWF